MTTLREAALMALKALEFGHLPVADQAKHRDVMSYIEAMDVLRKALDADGMASLPDPVAWMFINAYGEAEDVGLKKAEFGATPTVPLYTAPLKREPLTDEEIDKVTDAQWARNNHQPIYAAHRAYARAIERAHGIGECT